MKRFHVHVSVVDLDQSIAFYSNLFNVAPTVRKEDYAKWMLDDPRLNFAISQRERAPGVNHLGLQVDDAAELSALRSQLESADRALVEERDTACCYARSDKYWIADPQGIAWETFHTLASAPTYGDDEDTRAEPTQACCVPQVAKPKSSCCVPGAC